MEENNIVELSPKQSAALAALSIDELNNMQQAVLKQFREGGDIVALSPTGTGKTLAFLLPMLEMLDGTRDEVQAVVVLPTRELARQVADVWKKMSTGIKAVCLHGGRPASEEAAQIKGAVPPIIIATPGRLNDHIARGTFCCDSIRVLILDEFDKSLELGFREEMENLQKSMPFVERNMLFSATDSDELSAFVEPDACVKIDFTDVAEKPQQRTAFYVVKSTQERRLDALSTMLMLLHGEAAIVFCNFREMVDDVYAFLKKKGLSVVAYHGGMEQKQRELALYKFRSGCAVVLVCTDVASRGLDIPDVRHVVHYQRPVNEESYIHRNGRTARWDAEGNVYLFHIEGGSLPEYVPQGLPEFDFKRPVPMPVRAPWSVLYVGKGKKDKISRGDIAGFFMKKGGAKQNELGTIVVFDRYSYVAVRSERVKPLLRAVANEKIKGIKTIIEEIK